jgi:acetyl-CoA C-acetyltransferase
MPLRWKVADPRGAGDRRPGRFAQEIVPIEISGRKGTVVFDRDEHPKATTAEALAGLKPAFQKDGTVTAGNAFGLNDGAAALVLASGKAAQGLRAAGADHGLCGGGGGPQGDGAGADSGRAGSCAPSWDVTPQSFDMVESNEAFAAQAIAVSRALDLDPAR